jgi:hypothetical protein
MTLGVKENGEPVPEMNGLPFRLTVQANVKVLLALGPETEPVTVIGIPVPLKAGASPMATWSVSSVRLLNSLAEFRDASGHATFVRA